LFYALSGLGVSGDGVAARHAFYATDALDLCLLYIGIRPLSLSGAWNQLLIFGCLARAPSNERGLCLLRKLSLAQFTARLFRWLDNWWLVFAIFDPLPPHTVAARYTRPIHTTAHNALLLKRARSQQSRRGKYGAKARRLCLSTPNDADLCRKKRSCGATRGSLFDHLVGR